MHSQILFPRNSLLQASRLPTTSSTYAPSTLTQLATPPTTLHQTRHARLIRRPRRPYTFTQMIQLSDGSTFCARTTSPSPLYRSTKDTRNHPIWQPTDRSLKNVELDEAGKLAAFRERFGRGFDLQKKAEEGEDARTKAAEEESQEMDIGALISGYMKKEEVITPGKGKTIKEKGGKK